MKINFKTKSNSGYTLTEVLFALWLIFCIALLGSALVVLTHFILKYW